MATICCSPPDERSSGLLAPFLDAREQRKDPFHVGFDVVVSDRVKAPISRFSSDRHAREEAPRLGHRRDAALDALGGRQRR